MPRSSPNQVAIIDRVGREPPRPVPRSPVRPVRVRREVKIFLLSVLAVVRRRPRAVLHVRRRDHAGHAHAHAHALPGDEGVRRVGRARQRPLLDVERRRVRHRTVLRRHTRLRGRAAERSRRNRARAAGHRWRGPSSPREIVHGASARRGCHWSAHRRPVWRPVGVDGGRRRGARTRHCHGRPPPAALARCGGSGSGSRVLRTLGEDERVHRAVTFAHITFHPRTGWLGAHRL